MSPAAVAQAAPDDQWPKHAGLISFWLPPPSYVLLLLLLPLRPCWLIQEDKWLRRCEHFAYFMCSNEGQADWQTPDQPLALYEGLAGGACLLSDLLDDPGKATFPLFELGK